MSKQEIKCPNCGKMFQIDDTGYTQIVQQIRDEEFNKELMRREEEIKKQSDSDATISRMEQEQKHAAELIKKDELINEKEKQIAKLRGELELQEQKSKLQENNLIAQHEGELKIRDEEIERLKDFRAKQGSKMIGESLEQHCLTQFNQLRATAFPNAYFEKDNDDSSGSKGDFIFRDYVDGTEYISIMFEMKNEQDATKNKKTNEHFFKELDKDRNEKNCEYAVLVSLLESDNELYNMGIVDVSHRYPKMFVVRPQYFIQIISLLRNAALNSLEYRKKLAVVESQQMDIKNFETNLLNFKEGFATSVRLATDRYQDAIKGIEKTIEALKDIKDNLEQSQKRLTTADKKLDAISIKKLAKDSPSIQSMLEGEQMNE